MSLVAACQSVPFVFPFMIIKSVLVQLNGVYVLHHMQCRVFTGIGYRFGHIHVHTGIP